MGLLEAFFTIGIFGMFFVFGMMVLSFIAFIFWILMLVDCVKRKFKDDTEKIIWILVIFFAHIVGALIYYFVVKINRDKKRRR